MTLIPPLCNLYLQVLSSMHAEREVCPTVWETGERATVCSWVTYVTLSEPPDVRGAGFRAMRCYGAGLGATCRDIVSALIPLSLYPSGP